MVPYQKAGCGSMDAIVEMTCIVFNVQKGDIRRPPRRD